MKSYLGDPQVKEKYLARVEAHAKADELIHGIYWSEGKGCAVGCTVETSSSPHRRYPIELGIPEWLAWLEDSLFESLSNGQAKEWPMRFLRAIPVGADLEPVRAKFLSWLLVDEKEGVLRLVDGKYDKKDEYTSKVQNAIKQVAELLENGAAAEAARAAEAAARAAEAAARAAEAAAGAAAEAARAAEAAAWAAEAAGAAWAAPWAAAEAAWAAEAAEAAGAAAWAAAWAAWAAPWAAAEAAGAAWAAPWAAAEAAEAAARAAARAARAAARAAQAEKLLELLREAK